MNLNVQCRTSNSEFLNRMPTSKLGIWSSALDNRIKFLIKPPDRLPQKFQSKATSLPLPWHVLPFSQTT